MEINPGEHPYHFLERARQTGTKADVLKAAIVYNNYQCMQGSSRAEERNERLIEALVEYTEDLAARKT